MHMRKHQRIWLYFQQHRAASIVAGHISVVAILGLLLLGNTMGMHIFGAFAQSPCAKGDQSYSVRNGDTLGAVAARYNTSWQRLAAYNHIANPNVIYISETVCIPGQGQGSSHGSGNSNVPPPAKGAGNYFPYGQCTWWANQRFHQLHGVYVPWTTNADAWAWTTRAYNYHWHVSGTPAPGDIVNFQPWVQGAYSLGHVAVVERVLGNGHFIASNMNWGAYYWQVTNVEFSTGPGVTFISY